MKKIVFIFMVVCLFAANNAFADLHNRGTDSLGYQLIYDDDIDITWYLYTHPAAKWAGQMEWAESLVVSYGEIYLTDWRLPTTDPCLGSCSTESEFGHIWYTELGGTIENPSPANLFFDPQGFYWTGTENPSNPDEAYAFRTGYGTQHLSQKDYYDITYVGFGVAVHPGDVASVVPEPVSSILFMTGGALLVGGRFIRRQKSITWHCSECLSAVAFWLK